MSWLRLYILLCREVGAGPEDRRLLEALTRARCLPRRFRGGAPAPSGLLRAASVALLAFGALACAARFLA